ncbi:TatD family hydrolase [Dysgonomonas sp. Marseille-P4361]|uniref:TatD family hydrolase n=1 Tax=Dysgonomonas sp. Marseille-P4361 TaxID=2161820 RepID=UPI000D560FC3|nr:TatD family hydrolase [Dysgonomonas sp. Marseille-P4361]
MTLFDIHTHNVKPYTKGGLIDIKSILNTFPEDFNDLSKSANESTWFSCGIHPWYVDGKTERLKSLEEIIKHDRVVAVGEVGLDKLKGPDLNLQIEVFEEQISLANKYGKPLIIHCVKAWDELVALKKGVKTDIPWIIHGYRGGVEQTKQLVSLGFYLSIGEKFNLESLKHIPVNSLFCETDESSKSIEAIYKQVSMSLGFDFNQFAFRMLGNMSKFAFGLTK